MMKIIRYHIAWIAFILFIMISLFSCSKDNLDYIQLEQTSLTVWQMPGQTTSVMNSYIVITKNKKVIVIDGGCEQDAKYLHRILRDNFDNHVVAWFISHPHTDHVGALTEILNNQHYKDLHIDTIYGSLPSMISVMNNEPQSYPVYSKFITALANSDRTLRELRLGEIINIDSVKFEILGVKNPEITNNFLNNSSVVIKVYNSVKSLLFTGDLGVEGGNKILANNAASLASEYVQMSHHGSNGVSKEFYMAVHPTYCLWPTPRWLWNNDIGKGTNSGHYSIMEVRAWMKQLGVQENFVMADGFYQVY